MEYGCLLGDTMNKYAQWLLGVIIVAEVGIFGHAYFFGPNSLVTIRVLEQELTQLELQNKQMAAELTQLEREIVAWHEDDFYREKIAREQLQMAYDGDEIYYLTSS